MTDHGLVVGTPEITSAGPIAFGPDGILFLADNAAAKIVGVDVADTGVGTGEAFELLDVDARLASFLGCEPDDVLIQDLAVHPVSHNVYLSVQRGRGEGSQPVLVRIDQRDGAIAEVELDGLPFAEAAIDRAPAEDDERTAIVLSIDEAEEVIVHQGLTIHLSRRPMRTATVTELAYVDGALLVAGLSNEEFSSRLRRIPFPFDGDADDAGLEIYHVNHGKWETEAPIRSFVPYHGGILAGYTCTPVVHIPLAELASGGKVVGRTVAELGFGNQPLDMVSVRSGGREQLLVANSARGLVKIDCADIDAQEPLTTHGEPTGAPRSASSLTGVMRLDNLGPDHVLALRTDGVHRHLVSLPVDSL